MPRPASVALRSDWAVLPVKRPVTCTSSSMFPGPIKRQVVRPPGWPKVMQSWLAKSCRRPGAKGRVDLRGYQSGLGIAEHKIEPDQPMGGEKFSDPLDREEFKEIGWRRRAQQATGRLAACHQLLPRIDQPVDRAGTTLMKGLAGAGECELAGRALHQPRAQAGFEPLNAAAQGVGGHAQPSRRLGKAAAADHLHKHGDFVQVEHVDYSH